MGVESVAADKCCMCGRRTKESWTYNGGCCPTNPWFITICNNCVPCPRPELSNSFEIEFEDALGEDDPLFHSADYITHPCLKQIRINLQMRRPLSCSRCGERLDWPLLLETKRTNDKLKEACHARTR